MEEQVEAMKPIYILCEDGDPCVDDYGLGGDCITACVKAADLMSVEGNIETFSRQKTSVKTYISAYEVIKLLRDRSKYFGERAMDLTISNSDALQYSHISMAYTMSANDVADAMEEK